MSDALALAQRRREDQGDDQQPGALPGQRARRRRRRRGARAGLIYDPQTAGGLLIALDGDRAEAFVAALRARGVAHATIIGEVVAAREDARLELGRCSEGFARRSTSTGAGDLYAGGAALPARHAMPSGFSASYSRRAISIWFSARRIVVPVPCSSPSRWSR